MIVVHEDPRVWAHVRTLIRRGDPTVRDAKGRMLLHMLAHDNREHSTIACAWLDGLQAVPDYPFDALDSDGNNLMLAARRFTTTEFIRHPSMRRVGLLFQVNQKGETAEAMACTDGIRATLQELRAVWHGAQEPFVLQCLEDVGIARDTADLALQYINGSGRPFVPDAPKSASAL